MTTGDPMGTAAEPPGQAAAAGTPADELAWRARRAGLAKALAEFPDDVAAAALAAEAVAQHLRQVEDVMADSWPTLPGPSDD